MQYVDIGKFLPLVNKPSRYIDNEINAAKRDPEQYKARFCLAFPDVYELGVSHLGLKILYSILNDSEDAMADRVYLPWIDLIDILRDKEIPLFALESSLAVKCFDVLALTLQSELNFTNVLELIDIAQIPVLAAEREEGDPIVMAGGPCAVNPVPLKPFVDVFFIGEAEEGILEIAKVIANVQGRVERIRALAQIEGCYVPVVHDALLKADPSFKIKVRKYAGFHKSEKLHTPQLLSWQLATHNRYVAEIMRGCTRGCRFCQAGYIYRPVRERNPDDILAKLLEEVALSGWDEAGLMSLSSSDYSCIKELLFALLASLDAAKTSVSLPSLRVDSLDKDLVSLLKDLGREGLTIAVEAGSQRLRDVINKNITEADITSGVGIAQELGWQRIKLYFMLGLPTETWDDIDASIQLIKYINSLSKGRMQINVSLSPFVPKPFTPFERCAFEHPEVLFQKANHIKSAFARNRNIKIKYHDIENSTLEALITRGDKCIGELIHEAWKRGARLDGWHEVFDFGAWQDAMQALGIDQEEMLGARDEEQALPWDFVDLGICRQWLKGEYDKALRAETTADCRQICTQCGICDEELHTVRAEPSKQAVQLGATAAKEEPSLHAPQYKYRVFYQKLDVLRFISHLDWMRMLYRIISKLELETVYTRGFNQRPKVSLSPPLPLGVQGEDEYFDLSFYTQYPVELLADSLGLNKIPGFKINKVQPLETKAELPKGEIYHYRVPEELQGRVLATIERFATADTWQMEKSTPTRSKVYDLKSIIGQLSLDGQGLSIQKGLAGPSIWDILAELLNCEKEELFGGGLIRKGFVWGLRRGVRC